MTEISSLSWSDAFTILPPSSKYCKNLRGDKILLPQSALEQLLAAAPTQTSTGATFTSRDPLNHYASHNGFRDSVQQLPQPLTFRLVNPKNSRVVYAGIREFSAPEASMAVSPVLAEALGLSEEDSIDEMDMDTPLERTETSHKTPRFQLTVHAQQLPKGTYVRLRPLEAGYNPDDWKPLLERQLRDSFTTLTRDSTLSVQGGQGQTFKLLVDKLAPEGDGICVVDTDIEVDIEALNEEQARETLRQIASRAQVGSAGGTSKGGELDVWKSVDGQVLPGDYVDYTLPSWDRSQSLELVLSNVEEADALDLFVLPRSSRQRGLPRDLSHVLGNFDNAQDGSKSISISPSNVEFEEAEKILVSIHAYPHEGSIGSQVPLAFTLRAKVTLPDSDMMAMATPEHSPDDEQCQNCQQWVPKPSMVLHENFCRRNNTVCPRCRDVFRKGSSEWEEHWHCDLDSAHGTSVRSKAKHNNVFHRDRVCGSCAFSTNSLPDLARHQTSICPGKLILCRFCHLEVPQEGDPFDPAPEILMSGMTAHELADGGRTTECHLCDKIIRLRDMETHLKHHELDKGNRSKPQICRNINCGRTLHGVGSKGQIGAATSLGQGPGNDLGLCSLCFGPLYVSMHDPEGKALRRRIERRYLSQLVKGCGKSHCGNEWCKTGRANLDLEPRGSNTQAALPLVKPLLELVSSPHEPVWFCVDEANQTRRKLAEMMAAEKVWDLEWCVAAAEAEKGSPDKMRDWLQAWAPRRS